MRFGPAQRDQFGPVQRDQFGPAQRHQFGPAQRDQFGPAQRYWWPCCFIVVRCFIVVLLLWLFYCGLVVRTSAAPLDAHEALFLLRNCFAIPMLTYVLRAAASFTSPVLEQYDLEIQNTLKKILNVQLTTRLWKQCSLPVKFGGLGIRSAKDVALPAFLSSMFSCHTNLLNCFHSDNQDICLLSALSSWTEKTGIASTSSDQRSATSSDQHSATSSDQHSATSSDQRSATSSDQHSATSPMAEAFIEAENRVQKLALKLFEPL